MIYTVGDVKKFRRLAKAATDGRRFFWMMGRSYTDQGYHPGAPVWRALEEASAFIDAGKLKGWKPFGLAADWNPFDVVLDNKPIPVLDHDKIIIWLPNVDYDTVT